jgi:hypothetical protein
METKIDFSKFKNESFFQKLKEFASKPPKKDLVYVFFGGTGAVGGQAVIEIIQAFDFIVSVNPSWIESKPLLLATGLSKPEIDRFKMKLEKAFVSENGHGFEMFEGVDNSATLTLKRKSGISIEFHELVAKPTFSIDLVEKINGKNKNEIKEFLNSLPSVINSPFESFLKNYIERNKFDSDFRFQTVISGIPIPSVAAYSFGSEIDKILVSIGVKNNDPNKEIERAINVKILHGFANDFGQIKNNLAYEVLIAHTTSVGGMYTIAEEGKPVINLGYAHSAMDDFLVEKQFYAENLTEKYSELGLKVLITAAAIGIDSISINETLPMKKSIFKKYKSAEMNGNLPYDSSNLVEESIAIFQPKSIAFTNKESGIENSDKINFEAFNAGTVRPEFALRSGENGMFSLDNAYALYLNMKVASQEELSHILVFNALFGDDKQRPWFENGICYQTETENATIVFSLLNNYPKFRKYQTSGFTPKALQDLGSAKHQCELHTVGLYMLLHKLKSLDTDILIEKVTTHYSENDVLKFVDNYTPQLTIENIIGYDPIQKAKEFSTLITINSLDELISFFGFNGDIKNDFIKTFLTNLLKIIKQTIYTITSLGTPIVYLDKEEVRILIGPFCAAIEGADSGVISHNNSLLQYIKDSAKKSNLDFNNYFEWVVANSGFIDLRPQATITTAKNLKTGLNDKIWIVQKGNDFRISINSIKNENNLSSSNGYFTSSGVVAFIGRITGLYEQLKDFDISLGTLNNWKALFPIDSNEQHPVIPGLIEAMRMYTEGLGKVTGFELLYPGFGYFQNK